MRKLMLSSLGCLALTLLVLAPSASAEPSDLCKWNTIAQFTPGLSSSSQAFTYKFSGEVLGCESSEPVGFSESGNMEAGQTVTEFVINSTTGFEEPVEYQEPVPTGSGSCGASTTTGTALTSWADGTHTVETYSTAGGLGAVVSGNVVESMTLTAVNAKPGDPTTFTIKTNRFAGYALLGALKLEPAEATATACTTSTGARTAQLNGEVAFATP